MALLFRLPIVKREPAERWVGLMLLVQLERLVRAGRRARIPWRSSRPAATFVMTAAVALQ